MNAASLFAVVLIIHNVIVAESNQHCTNYAPVPKFHKIRTCFKSQQPVIASIASNSPGNCAKYARDRKGLAFNFSPVEGLKINNTDVRIYRNCQVLGCPETKNTATLIPDPLFDYYSAYGDLNATENSTCVSSLGLFTLSKHEKLNYTQSLVKCQDSGGDLADVMSEARTHYLATLIGEIYNGTRNWWYKAAYVGLTDRESEGRFENPMGFVLTCTRFRAWSPGHPRIGRQSEDCVILDDQKTWRVINCRIKLGFICELFPQSPREGTLPNFDQGGAVINCTSIKNKHKKKKCVEEQILIGLYHNSTREEQCALVNFSP